ncbi:MAG: hypothetical protein IBJ18_00055 [Phycisphaerales bacterium]|nr:hypothetical protein [Phycisphaerales bacterium]
MQSEEPARGQQPAGTASPTVLHVLDPRWSGHDATLALKCCVDLLSDVRQYAIIAGSRQSEIEAADLGVTTGDRVNLVADSFEEFNTVGFGATGIASIAGERSLRELLTRRLTQLGDVRAVCVWSSRLAGVVAQTVHQATNGQTRTLAMLTTGPRETWLESDLCVVSGSGVGRARPVCFDEEIAQSWNKAGVGGVEVIECPVATIDRWSERRRSVREELRITPEEIVLGVIAEPVKSIDMRLLTWIAGVLTIAGRKCVAIAPRGSGQSRRAARYLYLHKREWDAVQFEGPNALALPAADIVLWDLDPRRPAVESGQPGGGQVTAKMVCAAGVPVFTVAGGMSRRTLSGAPGWCLSGASTMPGLGAAGLALLDDPALRTSVGQSLINGVNAGVTNARFAQQMRGLIFGQSSIGGPQMNVEPVMAGGVG